MTRPFVPDLYSCLVDLDATINTVVRQMDQGAIGICLVVDQERRLIATITDGDVRRAMLAGVMFDQKVDALLANKATHPISPVPVTCPVATGNDVLLEIMRAQQIHHIPLLDRDGRVVDVALLPRLINEPERSIQAVVMAGGFGTRLRPFTHTTPKPMLPVGDKPLLERTIQQLRTAGITEVNITTHYLPEQITNHFGSGSDFGVSLNYVQEDRPLGTAGALGLLEQPVGTTLVMNGDILTTVDFRAMADFHRSHGATLTVAVRHYEVKVPYGVVEGDGIHVRTLREKPVFQFFVNAGIYLIEPKAWRHIPRGEPMDMPQLIEKLIAENEGVINFPIREYWMDIGQPDEYLRAQTDVESGKLKQ